MLSEHFEVFRKALVGQHLSHMWRGYGSAIFLEFGALREVKNRKRGISLQGQLTIMISWSWRVEDQTSILCGSWSDEELWHPTFQRLLHHPVTDLQLFGKLPELSIGFSNNMSVLSFMTNEGQPQWTIFENASENSGARAWITVEDGVVVRET